MEMTRGDQNVVFNIRFQYGEKVIRYTDEHIAKVWRVFSQSEDYPNEDKFLEWLSDPIE